MQKLETEAEYAQKIAVEKGLAEMEKMKQVTDAERDKELAEIEAAKTVAVENFAKEKALVVANKLLEVEQIEKAQALVRAAKGLEVAEFGALAALEDKKAEISAAEAKKESIELSGAITEQEEVLAKINAQKEVEVAKYLSQMQSPWMVNIGGDGSNGTQGLDASMLNIAVMKAAGVLPSDFSVGSPMPSRK